LQLGKQSGNFWGYIVDMSNNESESDPASVVRITQSVASEPGDVADAADRLTMIMEAEAIHNSLNGDTGEYGGEGSLDGLLYPLEDTEYTLAANESEDSSDDSVHAGGVSSPPIVSVEVAAMHFIDTDEYVDDESDQEKANPLFDQFDEPVKELTPEDETLLGVDPYDA
jgi:hypothetical protein